MAPSLLAQYDDVVSFLIRQNKWEAALRGRVMRFMLTGKGLLTLVRAHRGLDLVTARQSPWSREVLAKIITANTADDETFREIALSEYPLDATSNAIRERYPDVDYLALSKLHESRTTRLLRDTPAATVGLVFGLGMLILKSVPEAALANYVDYDQFQFWTFWATVGFAGYVAFVLAPLWLKYLRAKTLHERIAWVLDYTALTQRMID